MSADDYECIRCGVRRASAHLLICRVCFPVAPAVETLDTRTVSTIIARMRARAEERRQMGGVFMRESLALAEFAEDLDREISS